MDHTTETKTDWRANVSLLTTFYNEKVADILLPNTILLCVAIFLAVLGNSVVMHIHWRKLNSSQNFRMFVPYLALSDLISCLVCGVISIWQNYSWFSEISELMCKLGWFIIKLFQATSLALLMTIAFQRYIRICRPYKGQLSRKAKILYILFLLLFVLFQAVPGLVLGDLFNHVNETVFNTTQSFYECRRYGYNSLPSLVYVALDNSSKAIFVLLLISLYFKSGLKLAKVGRRVNQSKSFKYKDKAVEFSVDMEENSVTIGRSLFYKYPEGAVSNGNISDNTQSTDTASNYGTTGRAYRKIKARNRKYQKINCMFLLISLIAVISFFPRIVISLVELSMDDFWYPLQDVEFALLFRVAVYRLYFASYVINPIVYSVMDIEFRKQLKLCLCHCRSQSTV